MWSLTRRRIWQNFSVCTHRCFIQNRNTMKSVSACELNMIEREDSINDILEW